MIHLNYRDARPIYCQITDGFREQIKTGILEKGDKLPSVRELAGSLAINPNTIQRAYRELEVEGWIATVPGKGCFVCGAPEADKQQEADLWEQFHSACQALLELGYDRQTLQKKIAEGGEEHD